MSANFRWVLLGVIVLLVVPAQLQLLPILLPDGWIPHLGIVVAFMFGLRYGEGPGVVAGLLLGLLFDRFTAGTVGHHIFVLPCIGVGAPLFWRLVSTRELSAQVIMLVLFVLGGELAGGILAHLSDAIRLDGWMVAHVLMPGILADVVFGVLILTLLEFTGGRRWEP